jgi:hypothetical protein
MILVVPLWMWMLALPVIILLKLVRLAAVASLRLVVGTLRWCWWRRGAVRALARVRRAG